MRWLAALILVFIPVPALAQGAAGACLSILNYGGNNTGTGSNDTAFSAALNANPTSQKCVSFPPGVYDFSTNAAVSLSGSLSAVTLIGAGSEVTKLRWVAGGGLTINLSDQSESLHVRDMSILTGMAGGTGLSLNQAQTSYSVNIGQSDVTGVTLRGSDGYAQSDYWQNGIYLKKVSHVSFDDVAVYGDGSDTHGYGVVLDGGSASNSYAVIFNFVKCNFLYLHVGIQYGNRIQGVSVASTNFGGQYGIVIPTTSGLTDQLSVTGSQFGNTQIGLWDQAGTINMTVSNNLFDLVQDPGSSPPAPVADIYLQGTNGYLVVGNALAGGGPSSYGVVVQQGSQPTTHGVITGNFIYQQNNIGVLLSTGTSGAVVVNNTYQSNAANTVNQGGSNNSVGVATP